MTDIIKPIQKNTDPFGLRDMDFRIRVPEKSELFSTHEAMTYIAGCDYPESADDLLLAWEIQDRFSQRGIETAKIMDAMCGPGRLGRELLQLGATDVTFHDGHDTMLDHATTQAFAVAQPGQQVESVLSAADCIPLPDNTFDLIVCHNSTHQMQSQERLQGVVAEFIRVTKPGGFVLIADYQRANSTEFKDALEQRLFWTRAEIVELLRDSFTAAFSKAEFDQVFGAIPGVGRWQVSDAVLPALDSERKRRVDEDPVKGHALDFSPISLRAMAQKEEI